MLSFGIWRKIAGTWQQLEAMRYPVSVPSGTPVTNVGLGGVAGWYEGSIDWLAAKR